MRNPLRRAPVEPDLQPDLEEAAILAAETAVASALRDPVFRLQQMERALVRAHLQVPGVLDEAEVRRLRYLISFARLTVFEPGAATGERGRGDVDVAADLDPFRDRVVEALRGPLRRERDPEQRLVRARAAFDELEADMTEQRRALLDRHRGQFSADELDAEVGQRSFVLVLGGGGGAGYVYIGAMKALLAAGKTPDYIVGSSIGAILGGIFARQRPIPIEDYIEFAHTLTYRGLLGPEPRKRRHGLVSLFSLRYDEFAADMFRRPDGEQMRMADLDIPFDCLVAGVREQPFSRLPARFRREEWARVHLRSLPMRPIGIGSAVASRLWQVASFIDSRVVKPMVVGGDELTSRFNVVDAQSFSAAIPGVLHHETKDERMVPLLDEWLADKQVAALVDGVAASNVPIELAWRRIRGGRLGTRNAVILALDCFHPQWDPKHLWLTPITRAVQVQMVRNAPYADHLVRMSPTLGATTLAPTAQALEDALEWGAASMDEALPVLAALTEPVWWEGERPAYLTRRTLAERVSQAPSMRPIITASRRQRERWRQFRDRHFT